MSREFLAFLLLIVNAKSAKLPDYLKKCHWRDPNFDGCFKEAVIDTIPKLAMPIQEIDFIGLEPLRVDSIEVAAGSGAVSVGQQLKNVKIYGISKIKDFGQIKFDRNTLILKIETKSTLTMIVDYVLRGKILLLPVFGKGVANITLVNLNVGQTIQFETHQYKGNSHYRVADCKIRLTDPDSASFQFDNLFDGNRELGRNINNVLNDNWKDIFLEVRPAYEQAFAAICKSFVNRLFIKLPRTELFPN